MHGHSCCILKVVFMQHYTPSAYYSLGYRLEYLTLDRNTHMFQYNRLLERFNKRNSQANIYLFSGLGFWSKKTQYGNTGFIGLSTDWENQRWFIKYENNLQFYDKFKSEFSQFIKGGFAPYVGNYGDLHTWIMGVLYQAPDNTLSFYPVIRFFKGNVLIEINYFQKKKWGLNGIYRF